MFPERSIPDISQPHSELDEDNASIEVGSLALKEDDKEVDIDIVSSSNWMTPSNPFYLQISFFYFWI